MADVEDDADFGSHFLDSMLEVEMTEEDNELDVSKNDDPLETLPPVPTFDLQSETLSYKDVYRSAVPQPVLASLPVSASNPCNVPLVIKPSPMVIYSGGMANALQKISPKSIIKNPAKNPGTPAKTPINPMKYPTKAQLKSITISGVNVKNNSDVPIQNSKFMQEVFKKEFVKNVFVKADPPWDISLISEEEMEYYKTCFKDVSDVQKCKLHCTICDKHLGCGLAVEKKINVHTMLKVLTCKPCFEFYGDGNFPCDQGDNCEIYCRWCGQGGALICCSFCPRVFCKRCVKRNYGPIFLKKIEKASDWACFCCAQKPLWPHRAVCRALLEFMEKKKTDRSVTPRDTTVCCKDAGVFRKRGRKALDKNKMTGSENLISEVKVEPSPQTPNFKVKSVMHLKTQKDPLEIKPSVQLKSNEKLKIPISSNGNSKTGAITNIFSPRSILAGNNIIRGFTSSTPTKLISTFPAPHLIQSPVVHGETLITPPSRLLLPSKPPATPPSQNNPYVRVVLTQQIPNLDVNKIPTVKIPHEVQGLLLRLIFPDNKMHYVRLASDGSGCKASKGFPMPQFKAKGASFVEENLSEAFKISKMLYEKLLRVMEKVNSRTKFTEESVLNSSVKKLHMEYEKAMELLQGLDKSLLESHENWKNGAKNSVDVIDISDDESSATKKNKPTKKIKTEEDSDIEILDDEVTMNGNTPSNSSLKEKYTSRKSFETGKPSPIHNVIVRKRRRGRMRRNSKKPKTAIKIQNGQPEEDPLRTDEAVSEEAEEPEKSNLDVGEEEECKEEADLADVEMAVKEEINGNEASGVDLEGA